MRFKQKKMMIYDAIKENTGYRINYLKALSFYIQPPHYYIITHVSKSTNWPSITWH